MAVQRRDFYGQKKKNQLCDRAKKKSLRSKKEKLAKRPYKEEISTVRKSKSSNLTVQRRNIYGQKKEKQLCDCTRRNIYSQIKEKYIIWL